ncbi:hypothetical protein JK358_06570 [Nocardia sp. 2]|uniref:Uncharacterized protein n=1 Tax=Nocardia acididurans TaxID=2802282 RepID=A0ABS1M1V5_9NOCA|nr:hypothetical protein [Nocardia acididurans]MBL1074055.1 hypothetical protein [Nocardia acididurans]
MVEILLAVHDSDDDVAELKSLFDELVVDDELRALRKEIARTPRAGTLGAEEIIRIVIDAPEFWGAVTTCVVAWLRMRRPQLRLKLSRPDGLHAEIVAIGGEAVNEAQVLEAIDIVRGENTKSDGRGANAELQGRRATAELEGRPANAEPEGKNAAS